MDMLKKELKLAGFPVNDDMAVLHAMFPQELKKHIDNKDRPQAQAHPQKTPSMPSQRDGVKKPMQYAMTVKGNRFEVTVEELN